MTAQRVTLTLSFSFMFKTIVAIFRISAAAPTVQSFVLFRLSMRKSRGSFDAWRRVCVRRPHGISPEGPTRPGTAPMRRAGGGLDLLRLRCGRAAWEGEPRAPGHDAGGRGVEAEAREAPVVCREGAAGPGHSHKVRTGDWSDGAVGRPWPSTTLPAQGQKTNHLLRKSIRKRLTFWPSL